jgi:hypothetical protein
VVGTSHLHGSSGNWRGGATARVRARTRQGQAAPAISAAAAAAAGSRASRDNWPRESERSRARTSSEGLETFLESIRRQSLAGGGTSC